MNQAVNQHLMKGHVNVIWSRLLLHIHKTQNMINISSHLKVLAFQMHAFSDVLIMANWYFGLTYKSTSWLNSSAGRSSCPLVIVEGILVNILRTLAQSWQLFTRAYNLIKYLIYGLSDLMWLTAVRREGIQCLRSEVMVDVGCLGMTLNLICGVLKPWRRWVSFHTDPWNKKEKTHLAWHWAVFTPAHWDKCPLKLIYYFFKKQV